MTEQTVRDMRQTAVQMAIWPDRGVIEAWHANENGVKPRHIRHRRYEFRCADIVGVVGNHQVDRIARLVRQAVNLGLGWIVPYSWGWLFVGNRYYERRPS